MRKDNNFNKNPHKTYINRFEPMEQSGEPMPGFKQVKQENH